MNVFITNEDDRSKIIPILIEGSYRTFMNGLSNTPSNYLPSKKSQLASQSRISKINELYEQRKREHRDSVVSNNSTSVVSEDNCIPIHGLTTYKIQGPYNSKEPSSLAVKNEIKDEELPSTFATTIINDRQEQEDYEEELKFTPRLRSRRSLLTMRKTESSPTEDSSTSLPRKKHRIGSLRKTLGNPLPLPYLSAQPNGIHGGHKQSVLKSPNAMISSSNVDKKRQIMESKWRKLVSQDKSMLESRLKELRRTSSPLPTTISPPKSTDSPTLASQSQSTTLLPINEPPPAAIENLQEEIVNTREKLDEIIDLLNYKKRKPFLKLPSFLNLHFNWNESSFWTLCIIILILCNIYVYYYL